MKYVSDLKELENKKFDSIKELEAAELEIKKAVEKKEAETKIRKQDATKVEDAFKNRNAARKEYNTKVTELRKEYNKKFLEAKKVLEEKEAELKNGLNEKEELYDKALKEFTDKHPEGYHMTLRDGDIVTTIQKSVESDGKLSSNRDKAFKVLDDMINLVTSPFWF